MAENWQDTLKNNGYGDFTGWLYLPKISSIQIEEKWIIRERQISVGNCSAVTYVLSNRIFTTREWAGKNTDEILLLIREIFPDLDTSDEADLGGETYIGYDTLRGAIDYLLSPEDEDEDGEDDEVNEIFGQLFQMAKESVKKLSEDQEIQPDSLLDNMINAIEGSGNDQDDSDEEDDREREEIRRRSAGYLPVHIEDRSEIEKADFKAIEYLKANQIKIVDKVLDALAAEEAKYVEGVVEFYDNDPRVYEILPELPTGKDMRGRVNCDRVEVVKHPGGKLSYTQFTFHRIWDDEHIRIVTMHGDRVVCVSDDGYIAGPEQPQPEGPFINPFTGEPIEYKKKK